ncbi:MAG: DUF1926 domain-containing protein [candidate division WOR-3 bacterium]|nr:MAG: DUF1926 domain-containing protein [candidate division WOR-3 bacterium]
MIRFAFCVHNHQPTGNFHEVFEYAYSHAYLPLLTCLMRHEHVKFAIHNSGILCEWITQHHPEYFEMLREAAARGQAEILTSAYGEPLLSFIPRKDAIDQIRYFNEYLHRLTGQMPKGLWLTERIWEPGLITMLLDSGIEYLLLDDTHFFYAGLDDRDLFSYYVTEEDGRVLKVFPISMKLRYLIPFHPVDETIAFLKETHTTQPGSLKTLADDGEKFGVWPGTYEWVYDKGWLDEFLGRLDAESWIRSVSLRETTEKSPAGRIYLPTSSYEEMGEWVLPPDAGRQYEELKRTVDRKYFHFIHGGYFKNFLRKYPEANAMQKRMIHVSKNIADTMDAKLALWRGQCSCAYWHGIFGGLYLPHLREAIYKNLIEAENHSIREFFTSMDFDADGEPELVFSDRQFFMVMKPRTGSFVEIDDRKGLRNILNYIGRVREKYHEKVSQTSDAGGVRSIHEIAASKDAHLADIIVYDAYPRGFGIDLLFDKPPSLEEFYRGTHGSRPLQYDRHTLHNDKHLSVSFFGGIEKNISLGGTRARTLQITYQGQPTSIGVEFSLGLFDKNLRLNKDKYLRDIQELADLDTLTIMGENISPISFSASENFSLLSYPIETVSSSEGGYEKNFQGFCMLMLFRALPTITIEL